MTEFAKCTIIELFCNHIHSVAFIAKTEAVEQYMEAIVGQQFADTMS